MPVVSIVMVASHGLSLHVTVTVAPENAEELLRRAKPILDLVAAEPECLYFEVIQSAEQPGRFKIVENWSKDLEWFMKVLSLSLRAKTNSSSFFLPLLTRNIRSINSPSHITRRTRKLPGHCGLRSARWRCLTD